MEVTDLLETDQVTEEHTPEGNRGNHKWSKPYSSNMKIVFLLLVVTFSRNNLMVFLR